MRNQFRVLIQQLAVFSFCIAPAWAQNDDWHGRHGSGPGAPFNTPSGRRPGPLPNRPPPALPGNLNHQPPPRPPGGFGYRPPTGQFGNWGNRPPPGNGYRPPPGFGGGYRPHPSPDAWRSGGWRREWHEGRFGWWWTVGAGWYAFDTPVYPYPAYAAPAQFLSPPTVVVEIPPPPPPGPAPTQFWYYCQDPQGYFPYVPACNGNWQEVSANATR